MFPGMGGRMNPKQLNAMMRQMGIQMEEIEDVEEVIIRTKTRDIVLTNAEVARMKARGDISWQITGEESERPRAPAAPAAPVKLEVRDEDVDFVAAQADVSKERARAALEAANGEPAEAILKLMEEE